MVVGLFVSYKARIHFFLPLLLISIGGCPKKSAVKGAPVQRTSRKLPLVNAEPPAMLQLPLPAVVLVALCVGDG